MLVSLFFCLNVIDGIQPMDEVYQPRLIRTLTTACHRGS